MSAQIPRILGRSSLLVNSKHSGHDESPGAHPGAAAHGHPVELISWWLDHEDHGLTPEKEKNWRQLHGHLEQGESLLP